MKDKLKPCPFCGGEAGISNMKCVVFHQERYSVCCENGDVEMPWLVNKKQAIKDWNRRTKC